MSFTATEKRDVLLKARIIFQDEAEAVLKGLAQMAPESDEAGIAERRVEMLEAGENAAKALWLDTGYRDMAVGL